MEIRWKNNTTKEIGVALINDDDANLLEFVGYVHCDNEDFTDDEYDGELVEVWKPANIYYANHLSQEWFGMVRWCNVDLENALVANGIDPTKNNINKLRDLCENNNHFTDGMVEAGWETINYLIDDNEWEKDEHYV